MKTSPDRYVFLDGLRGLAALSIIVHHFTQDSGHGEVFASASISVDFFFCLSGFVIAHAYHNRLVGGMPLGQYMGKRLSRLYPMYLMGTLLGVLGVVMLRNAGLTSFSPEKIATAAALNIFYLPYINDEYVITFAHRLQGAIFPLDNPAWSLFFGMVANLLYAVCLRLSRNAPVILATASAIALVAAMVLWGEAPGWGQDNFLGGFPRVMFTFFAGVVIYQFHARTGRLPRLPGAVIAGIIVALVAMPRFPMHRFYWLTAAIIAVPVIVAMGSWVKVAAGTRWHRLCGYSGRLSYPLFCVHYPIMMFFSLLPRDNGHMELFSLAFLDFLMIAAAFFFTTIAVAHVLLTRVEDPARAWLTGLRERDAARRESLSGQPPKS